MPATQILRPFRVKVQSLDDDALLLESFVGNERVSAPYHFILRVLSTDTGIDMKGLLTKPAVLTIKLSDETERHIHGDIRRMRLLEYGIDGYAAYEIEIVPWIWFLNLFSNCRIFQKKSVPDIIEQVFKDRGYESGSEFKLSLQGNYQPREYCVQYRETDFNFVSRLMEEEGIFYFFEQTEDKHTMVLADQKSAFHPCPNQPKARYRPSEGGLLETDTVDTLEEEFQVYTGTSSLSDYNFQKPALSLYTTLAGESVTEEYDYPGRYLLPDDGSRYARLRLEERAVRGRTVRGSSNCMGFECGYKFTLEEFYRDSDNIDYTITALEHYGQNTSYRSTDDPDPFEYHNSYEAIPNSLDFRPPRLARKPIIQGTQTAVVVGPSGSEIYPDEFGRIKVQFFWDRLGKMDENSSCWIRVAQTWAGSGWGNIFIPRIGHEVVVSFLEGDPDRPLVTGCVYNAAQIVPYALPDNKTRSTIKSNSSPGSGGFNEIRFEDKAGSEQIFTHGQKDLDIRIEHDRKEWIGEDRHLVVTRDKMEQVQRDSHIDITRDQIEKFGRDHHVTISGKEAIQITGSHSMQVTGDVIEQFSGNQSTQVTQNLYIKGMQVVIEALMGLTLKMGPNFITLDPSGVAISGVPIVQINSAGAALSGSPGSPVSPLSPTDPQQADKADAGKMVDPSASPAELTSLPLTTISPAKKSPASSAPTHNPDAPENKDKKHWIEIELLDEDGKPIAGEPYQITLPDGTTIADGTTNDKGRARVDNIDPGSCKITFPNLDQDVWKPK